MIKLFAILLLANDVAGFPMQFFLLNRPSIRGHQHTCRRPWHHEVVRSIQSEKNGKGDGVDTETSREDQSAISKKNASKLARGLFELGETVATIVFTTFGAVFAIGLVLNLSGYGYQFSLSEGIRIDTLDEMRLERQLERGDSGKIKVSESAGSTPVSQLMEFCYRQPFTASLTLTGVAVACEEVVKMPLARRQQEKDDIQ